MNKFFGIMIICSIFLISACTSTAAIIDDPLNKYSNKTLTVLFSDSSTLQNESTYYDAILELKTTHDINPSSILIIDATEHDILRYYKIEEIPTMLVLSGEKEHVRLEGIYSKDTILAHLLKVYQLKEEASLPIYEHLS